MNGKRVVTMESLVAYCGRHDCLPTDCIFCEEDTEDCFFGEGLGSWDMKDLYALCEDAGIVMPIVED